MTDMTNLCYSFSQGVPKGWLPVNLGGRYLTVRWIQVGEDSLPEPFYHHSVKRLRDQATPAPECETSPELVESAPEAAVVPAGIIMQMSRCGSTLMSNGLRVFGDVVSISEATPIAKAMQLMRTRSNYHTELGQKLLSAFTTIFASYQGIRKRRVVLKCTPDASLSWRSVRRLWPQVPCVILIRDPVEVLVSNIQEPPLWLPSADRHYGKPPRDVQLSEPRERLAWAIGRACGAALEAIDQNCMVLDYRDLGPAAVEAVARYFGLVAAPDVEERLRGIFAQDAKRPSRSFEPDASRKQRDVNDDIRRSADQWITEAYLGLKGHARGTTFGQVLVETR